MSLVSRREFLKTAATGAIVTLPWLSFACGRARDFDVLILGGLIYDGSGRPGILGDLGIKNGRIAALGDLNKESAKRKIDANGLAVAPGFIDFHSHSDDELLLAGEPQSKIRQGVTTEIIGQDGDSMAPLTEKMRVKRSERLQARYGIEIDWTDFAGYFRRLEKGKLITNVASMLGQGTLREYVVGEDDRPATPEEIEKMKSLAREAFRQGAYGISSGLEYTPGSFASTEEIIEVCKAMDGHGIYSTHMRNEDDTVLEAVDEAIRIARESGVALNISHLKAQGPRNWHKLPRILEKLDQARFGGLKVTCDRYPYIAYHTDLSALFPLWSREGGEEKFVERLKDSSLYERLRREVTAEAEKIGGWQSVMIASLPQNPQREKYEGKTLAELAQDGTDPFRLLVDVMIQEKGGGSMVGFGMSEEELSGVLAYPHAMIASDASALAVTGKLRYGNPHPRAFGTFPRLLGKYVREEKLILLTEAIHKITSLPAATLGLQDRGLLQIGNHADVVIFDPHKVIDRATWTAPHQYPEGIKFVLVNGEIVIDQGEFTGKLAGQVLRGPFGL
ncbi:MAG: D-aminoacylase [candidate division KSB1 bacterium]|nr:D-aminoacylase [candidate division KSB1 bacterium]MDZ7301024.1 D-aminoacylase [candidate division KSB1 bacterium]MDZ7310298.1 D-aminoacylase [candidate division KSB1 bacterium]